MFRPAGLPRHRLGPHDAKMREAGAPGARTRIETLALLGRKPELVLDQSLMDGLNAGRKTIPFARFDKKRTAQGVECLRSYPLSNSSPITPNTLETIESEPRQDEAAFAVSGPTRSRRITRLRDPRAKSNDVFERCGS
jgi:hypothetical protein